jgi:hypothetical protein
MSVAAGIAVPLRMPNEEKRGSVVAVDERGTPYTLNIFVRVFDGRDGITFLRTDDDAPVEYIEKGVYAIATGSETITIRSDDPDAP